MSPKKEPLEPICRLQDLLVASRCIPSHQSHIITPCYLNLSWSFSFSFLSGCKCSNHLRTFPKCKPHHPANYFAGFFSSGLQCVTELDLLAFGHKKANRSRLGTPKSVVAATLDQSSARRCPGPECRGFPFATAGRALEGWETRKTSFTQRSCSMTWLRSTHDNGCGPG